jgi:hypothetical protein
MCFTFQAFHICANDGQGEVAKILSDRKIEFFALKWVFTLPCSLGNADKLILDFCARILVVNFLCETKKNNFCIILNYFTFGVSQRSQIFMFLTLNLL